MPPRAMVSAALWALGLLLLLAAVWAVVHHAGAMRSAWDAAWAAPWWCAALLLVLPIGNWLVTTMVFHTLTSRFGRVTRIEMSALIGSAWLLNYLPFKPGLVGRVAYHKAVSGIPVRSSLRVLVEALLLTTITYIGAALILLASVGGVPGLDVQTTFAPGWAWRASGAALGLVAIVGAPLVCVRGRATLWADVRVGLSCVAWRLLDLSLWTLRYWVAFTMIGQGLDLAPAALLAMGSQLASQVPIALGVREWAVGAAGGLLLRSGAASAGATTAGATTASAGAGSLGVLTALAISAELLNRAAELVVALVVGLLSARWLRQHARAHATDRDPPPASSPGT